MLPAMKTRPAAGVALVLGAAALWGTTGTAQSLAEGQITPLWFGSLRLAAACAFLAACAALEPRACDGHPPLPRLELLGAGLCMATYNLAFFAGIRLTGVALGTAVALGSGPLWAGMLQALAQGRPPARGWWAGTTVAVAGGVLMTLGNRVSPGTATLSGIMLCLVCGLSYASYALLNQRLAKSSSAARVTMSAFAVATAVGLPVAWVDGGWPAPTGSELAAVAYTGVVTAGIAYLLFSNALRHIGSATAVTLALFEPIVAFGLAVGLLGETPAPVAYAGLALVIAGVMGVVRQELRTAGARALSSRAIRAVNMVDAGQ